MNWHQYIADVAWDIPYGLIVFYIGKYVGYYSRAH